MTTCSITRDKEVRENGIPLQVGDELTLTKVAVGVD